MNRIERLADLYAEQIGVPWPRTTAGAQRVVMVVYEKEDERTLRARVGAFEQATVAAGRKWKLVDATTWFAEWLASDEYHDEYFRSPDLLAMKLRTELVPHAAAQLRQALEAADGDTVVALMGVASLFGFLHVSRLVQDCEHSIRGRLLVFFPGTKNGSNYRLLDARDGWNYLAHAITLHGGTT